MDFKLHTFFKNMATQERQTNKTMQIWDQIEQFNPDLLTSKVVKTYYWFQLGLQAGSEHFLAVAFTT